MTKRYYSFKEILTSLKRQRKIHKPYKQLDLYGGVVYEMTYEKQEGGFWTPNKENDKLEGKVIDIVEGNFGKQYVIETKDGEMMTTPSHSWLQNGMRKAKIDDKVKIVFTGTEPPKISGHSPSNIYEVYIDV